MQTKAKKARNVKAVAPAQAPESLLPAIVPGAPVASALPVNAPAELPAPPAEIILPESALAPAELVYKSATRDAATIAAGATNFDQYSNRDTAYLAFFGSVMRANGNNDSATLAQIHAAGKPRPGKPHLRDNPYYTGSAKATDAGAIVRLVKAGYITASPDGSTLRATDAAKTQAAYNKH